MLANVSTMSSNSSDLTSSDSIANTDSADNRSCPMVVRSTFFIRFKCENDLSPLAFATASDRNILSAVPTFGNVARRSLSTMYCSIAIGLQVLIAHMPENCRNSSQKLSSRSAA